MGGRSAHCLPPPPGGSPAPAPLLGKLLDFSYGASRCPPLIKVARKTHKISRTSASWSFRTHYLSCTCVAWRWISIVLLLALGRPSGALAGLFLINAVFPLRSSPLPLNTYFLPLQYTHMHTQRSLFSMTGLVDTSLEGFPGHLSRSSRPESGLGLLNNKRGSQDSLGFHHLNYSMWHIL